MSELLEYALSEYDSESEESKDKIIYAYFWLAIYAGQCLEKEFENMLILEAVVNGNIKTPEQFEELAESIERSRSTMWTRIKEVWKVYDFSDEIKAELADLVKVRNHLAHCYFKENIHKFASNIWCREMLEYFVGFKERAASLDGKLAIYWEKYRLACRITDEALNKMVDAVRVREAPRDD